MTTLSPSVGTFGNTEIQLNIFKIVITQIRFTKVANGVNRAKGRSNGSAEIVPSTAPLGTTVARAPTVAVAARLARRAGLLSVRAIAPPTALTAAVTIPLTLTVLLTLTLSLAITIAVAAGV